MVEDLSQRLDEALVTVHLIGTALSQRVCPLERSSSEQVHHIRHSDGVRPVRPGLMIEHIFALVEKTTTGVWVTVETVRRVEGYLVKEGGAPLRRDSGLRAGGGAGWRSRGCGGSVGLLLTGHDGLHPAEQGLHRGSALP